MRLFKNLRALLDVKRKTTAEGGDGLIGYQDSQARGYDRFVVRDWKSNYSSKYSNVVPKLNVKFLTV